MKNTVMIKGNRYGISIVLDATANFEIILSDLAKRLEGAEHFFDSDKQLAISFEGRTVTNEEIDQILSVIDEHSKLNIQYIVDENSDLETTFYDVIRSELTYDEDTFNQENVEPEPIYDSSLYSEELSNSMIPQNDKSGLFYKGTLRSGQTVQTNESLIMIGDVHAGATIIAGGNIIIIGTLKGDVHAGANGNKNAFVLALSMAPTQIQIADIVEKNTEKRIKFKDRKEPMIATIIDDQIIIESASKTAIQEVKF